MAVAIDRSGSPRCSSGLTSTRLGIACRSRRSGREMAPSADPLTVRVTMHARRAGPREHGRQAARSKRAGPSGHASKTTDSATCAPPQAALIPVEDNSIPVEDNSATQRTVTTL
jgi:hypothetical protein